MSQALAKSFSLHPSILYSIINEQAGDPVKSITELVMNSLDAGATEVELHINATDFSVKDNGVGFKSADDIDNFFGTFGTPHAQGDATYGKFRIGRGQNFAIASSVWRSGHFGMTVDLAGKTKKDIMGYARETFDEFQEGCVIRGEFYKPLNVHEGIQSISIFNNKVDEFLENFEKNINNNSFASLLDREDFMSRLVRSIGLVDKNVYINGVLITNNQHLELIHEDELAKYYLSKSLKNYNVHFNKGIYISHEYSYAPLIVDFKISPNLNLARNQVNSDCPTYNGALKKAMLLGFNAYIKKQKWASKLFDEICIELDAFNRGALNSVEISGSVLSLITSENIEEFLNCHSIKFFKDGKLSSYPYLAAISMIQADPTEYVLNTLTQLHAINASSQQTLRNSLELSNFQGTLVFDEHSLILCKGESEQFKPFLREYFPKYAFDLNDCQNHSIFSDWDDLDEYKISKNVKKKQKIQKVEAKATDGNFNNVEQYFVDIGYVYLPMKRDCVLDQSGEILSGYVCYIANLLKEHFQNELIQLPDTWLLSQPVESIIVMPCISQTVLSGVYEDKYYIFVQERTLKEFNWTKFIMPALLNDVGVTSEIVDMFSINNPSQACVDTLNTIIYDHDEVHHQIHNSLDGFLENNMLFDLFEEAQNQLAHLEHRKTKIPHTNRKDMKRLLDLISVLSEENPELTKLLKPELELMDQIYLDV